MGKYVIKRVLMAVLTLFIVICLTFFLMNAVPGSPWLSERTPSQATIDALNAKYGLDKPVIVQLGLYLQEGGFADLKRVRADVDLIDAAGHGSAQVFVARAAAAVQHQRHVQQRF